MRSRPPRTTSKKRLPTTTSRTPSRLAPHLMTLTIPRISHPPANQMSPRPSPTTRRLRSLAPSPPMPRTQRSCREESLRPPGPPWTPSLVDSPEPEPQELATGAEAPITEADGTTESVDDEARNVPETPQADVATQADPRLVSEPAVTAEEVTHPNQTLHVTAEPLANVSNAAPEPSEEGNQHQEQAVTDSRATPLSHVEEPLPLVEQPLTPVRNPLLSWRNPLLSWRNPWLPWRSQSLRLPKLRRRPPAPRLTLLRLLPTMESRHSSGLSRPSNSLGGPATTLPTWLTMLKSSLFQILRKKSQQHLLPLI